MDMAAGEGRCLDLDTRCLHVGTAGAEKKCLDLGTRCLNMDTGA